LQMLKKIKENAQMQTIPLSKKSLFVFIGGFLL